MRTHDDQGLRIANSPTVGYVCTRCDRLCDTVEVSEPEAEEVCGSVETYDVTFLVSACCAAGVEETMDGAMGEPA